MKQKRNKPTGIYLIQRGPKSIHHNAPFHPVIICTRKHTADWETGDSNAKSTVWTKYTNEVEGGFLTKRYKGFDIDYGHVVKQIQLWDGETAAFNHDRDREPWTLLNGAIWWSDQEMPKWLADAGVTYAQDKFTKDAILNDRGTCLLRPSEEEKLSDKREQIGTPEWLK